MQNPINFRSAGTINPSQSAATGSSSGSSGNGGGSNTTATGAQKKQHKYPKRLSQNQEKRVEGSGSASSYRPTTSTLSKTRVEEMYNSRTNQDRDTRNASPIIPLRNFNNWVKGVLIYKYVPMQSVVLDISCGKGGDLFKYHFRNIKYYVGADIAHASLVDCSTRYNENSAQFKFPITLIHADVGKTHIDPALPRGLLFDAVSCQFAAHYMFDAEEHARMLLRNVTDRLKNGGKFILTTSDAYVLVKMLRNVQGYTLKNDVFEATFHCAPDKSFPNVFGNRYDFQLIDAVDLCPEYLVPPKQFIDLAREFNLHIVEHLNFHDFYEKYGSNQETKVNVKPELKLEGMTEDLWTAIYLYRAFVFEKRGGPVPQDQYQMPTGYKKLSQSDIISLK
ncbi:hypothetical protein C9374_003868 [Naegleria lovaniensis]|uniref:mRNA cap guanine-N(7) methyltransferase n=1 Tax=Naegleria lovaniensis TaxID=51637 RepID=A0AA88KT11_NAELO|nr:uncharacterized protein C9374_003868 [Naegleria lovaniensis]KAG2394104.1 hypothetical protein C9374_003868 [Naegleria lovaniensis]